MASSSSFDIRSKRSRPEWSMEHPESNTLDIESPPRMKRLRILSETTPPSPTGIVSLTPPSDVDIEYDHNDNDEGNDTIHDIEMKNSPLEWWKQRPNEESTKTTRAGARICSVCCKEMDEPILSALPQRMHVESNSLLNYFSVNGRTHHSSSSSLTSLTRSIQASTMRTKNSCSFCDRQACTACLRDCEECHFSFCSLCSVVDYNERIDRCYCLDCHQSNRSSCHDDAMILG